MFGVDTPRFVESLPSRGGRGEEQTSPSTRLFLSICLPSLPPPANLTGELLTGIVQTCDIYHALLTTSRRSKCIISINVEGIARSRLSIALNWNNGPSLSVGRFENSNGNGRGTSIRFPRRNESLHESPASIITPFPRMSSSNILSSLSVSKF